MNRLSIAVVFVVVAGCHHKEPAKIAAISGEPGVRLVKPEIRDLTMTVGQPSFIDAYEQTAIYAKLAGYVAKWNVDIGDRVKKDDLLATIYIPELEQEHNLKKATVVMDTALVEQARKLVEVANGNLQAATAMVSEAKDNVGKFDALVLRWTSEVKRQTSLVKDKVVDQQVLDESTRQLESSVAAQASAKAAVRTAEANRLAREADLAKAKVDVLVAQSKLSVSEADEKRLAALYSYTRLTSPYDGIIVLRNINTGDFVLPASGDPSASSRSPDQAASRATPVYVVARLDIVRVYVDVPEKSANAVVSDVDRKHGDTRPVTPAKVRVSAFQEAEIPATVTRSSWALNVRSRTLRAEIDLPNPKSRLLPGMYAYGLVEFTHKNVRVVPKAAVTEIGNENFCYLYDDGKAIRTSVETSPGDGTWINVVRKQVDGKWVDFTGEEQVILADLAELSDGMKVRLETNKK